MLLLPAVAQPLDSFSPPPIPHVHRWRIGEQAGARSAGLCDCGEERAFQNGWEGDGSLRLRSGSWLARREAENPGQPASALPAVAPPRQEWVVDVETHRISRRVLSGERHDS